MTNESLRQRYEDILYTYQENLESFELFHKRVKDFFESRSLSDYVHSVRYRLKDVDHLLEKIDVRMLQTLLFQLMNRGPATKESLFSRVTDIAGIESFICTFSSNIFVMLFWQKLKKKSLCFLKSLRRILGILTQEDILTAGSGQRGEGKLLYKHSLCVEAKFKKPSNV